MATITVYGVQQTIFEMGELIEDFNARLDALIQHTGQEAEGIATDNAAVRTGLMRASIGYTPGYLVSEVHCYVFYSIFVDRGTYKMAAQPFMTPAFETGSANLQAGVQAL